MKLTWKLFWRLLTVVLNKNVTPTFTIIRFKLKDLNRIEDAKFFSLNFVKVANCPKKCPKKSKKVPCILFYLNHIFMHIFVIVKYQVAYTKLKCIKSWPSIHEKLACLYLPIIYFERTQFNLKYFPMFCYERGYDSSKKILVAKL